MANHQDLDSHLEDGLLIQKESSELYAKDGSVDLHGKPVVKSKTGNWRASLFIIANECAERLAYLGIASNLVTYLKSKLHEGNVSAARNVSTWTGTCYLTPLIGAFLADAYWGRYRTIAVFSTIYLIGMCTLALSASVPALSPAECLGSTCSSATTSQYTILFLGLYLIAFGAGGIKPCVSSFGADQFDDADPRERAMKGSFFNWFFFATETGSLVSSSLIVWIQENVGWGLGFGIPALCMGIAVVTFFAGTPLYRFQRPGGSPLTRICQVVVASSRKRKLQMPEDYSLLYEAPCQSSTIVGSPKLEHTDGLEWLTKASVLSDAEIKDGVISDAWKLCTVTQVEELKSLIRMLPIWLATVSYSIVYAQVSTTFVEQGKYMDRTIGSFTIPAASMLFLEVSSGMLWVLIYDKLLVLMTSKFTGNDRGLSELQRMGIGLLFSALALVSASLVETRRLQLAKELELINENLSVPLTILWQIPQYFLVGGSAVFTYVGRLEFSYNHSPNAMRSLCTALSLLISSLGSYMSSLILTVVTVITTSGGNVGWIPDNLNEGHLDYFFWLLACLCFLNFLVYCFCAARYRPKTTS